MSLLQYSHYRAATMLSAAGKSQIPVCNSAPILTTIPHQTILLSYTPLFPCRTRRILVSSFSNASSSSGRCGFRVAALTKLREENGDLVDMEDFDFDDEDDDGNDGEEDETFLPLGYMKKWLENKPPGFGEGKAYDTSVEDELMDEIEQSRQAQLANINKLKNNPSKPQPKKGQLQKAPELFPSGPRVRLSNLPKKKNIHKDLKLVFKDFPGVLKIVPAVSGNEKTRDPVCKGFAFVDLKSREDADRFVQTFSGKSIAFGKIQKQLKCDMMIAPTPNSTSALSANRSDHDFKLPVISGVKGVHADVDLKGIASMGSSEETDPNESHELDNDLTSEKLKQLNQDTEIVHIVNTSDSDGLKENTVAAAASSSYKKAGKAQKTKKKVVKKVQVIPKLNIPGSATRLKVKEKAVLTDVFSKYGTK